jgi:hypothetical protein
VSKESRQRLREAAKQKEKCFAGRKKFLALIVIVLAAVGAFAWIHFQLQKANAILTTESSKFKQPQTLKELLALSPAELEHCDIARMNLLCAEGLPGAENLNVNECMAALDQWAQHIQSETARNFHHFKEDPAYFYNSENFYKMLMMSVVLYDDFQIRYDPKWIESPEAASPHDHFFADSRDVLIHGLVGSSRIGTCSSLPVLYIGLARRLGYPVYLVSTKGHLFMRWDSPTEKFDMDATGKGLNEYTDEHYKQWPFPVTDEEIRADGYFKSMNATEELSVFLSIRGMCLEEARRFGQAVEAFAAAKQLVPQWRVNQVLFADAQEKNSAASAFTTAQTKSQNQTMSLSR